MLPHTRAILAACAYAVITGRKAAGLYDFTAGDHLRIAAECRGTLVQGSDGERSTLFGGTLPDLHDHGSHSSFSLVAEGNRVTGYDHGSASHYVAEVNDRLIQLYDHQDSAWFAFEAQAI